MKKFFLLLLSAAIIFACGSAYADVAINETNFPDEKFRTYLATLDSDSDGTFSDEEIASITSINCSSMEISNLIGIKNFTSLTELNCSSNQLTTLDISGLSSLQTLSCPNNQLTKINAIGCSALTDENITCDNGVEITRENSDDDDDDNNNEEEQATAKPIITTESFALAVVGQEYEAQIEATGGAITWIAPALPKGLEFDDGKISGTPERAGNYTLKFRAKNSKGLAIKSMKLSIVQAPEIEIDELKNGKYGESYGVSVKASGTKPKVWSAENLPAGLKINKDNGKISGKPTEFGTFNINVTVTNDGGVASKDFELVIVGVAPKITGSAKTGDLYKDYKASFTTSKGTEPLYWDIEGELPAGLEFSDGIISGQPTATWSDYINIHVSNDFGEASKRVKLKVKGVAPKVTTKKLKDAKVGQAYSVTLEATGSPTIEWSAEDLPAGLTLEGNILSGTPTEAGNKKFTVTVTNPVKSCTKRFKLKIKASDNPDDTIVEPEPDPEPEPVISQDVSPDETTSKAEKIISFGDERTVKSLSPRHLEKLAGFEIAAVLPEISVNASGLYDIEVDIDEKIATGAELIYLAFPKNSEPSEDDEIVEFYDVDGAEILDKKVPENHKIILAAWFNEGIIYEPVLAVKKNKN